ncbi:MAG: CPBP family intramembrane metalloprotease [Betaproteobacteria bacterium]|nr:CPBP family intramembrane metalloprotease [Betaproteobacteria bacterium]
MLQPGDDRKIFPNLAQAIGLLVALFAISLLLGAAYHDFVEPFQAGDPLASGAVSLLAAALLLSFVTRYKRLSFARLLHDSASSQGAVLVLLTLPVTLLFFGAMILLDDVAVLVNYVFPMSQSDIDMFQRLMSGGAASFIAICIIAPVTEEMLFRGIFLRSFLHQYSPRQAIVFSSALFAVAHLNLYQAVPAFFVGLIIGWIYWRVQSLWPCIIAHMAYNVGGYVVGLIVGDTSTSTGPEFAPLPLQILGVICTAIGANLLWKLLGPRPAGTEAPAE